MFPIGRILRRAALNYPDQVALIDGDTRLTFAELQDRVARLATALLRLGLKQGDRVAVLDANSFRFVEAYYACAAAGLVIVPLNARLAAPELQYMLGDVEARALLVASPFLATIEPMRAALPRLEFAIVLDRPDGYEALIADAPPLAEDADIAPQETLQIYYTGGTTGTPKGVCLSHESVVLTALDTMIGMRFTAQDRWLHAAPLFHLADAWAVWCLPLVGARQVVVTFSPETILCTIERERITKTVIPVTLLNMLANHPLTASADLASLDLVMFGASPPPEGVIARTMQAMPCDYTHCYGLTEIGGAATLLAPEIFHATDEEGRKRQRSAGHPCPHVEVAILDDALAPLPASEIGEIALRGPRVMKEYWRKPAETAAALRGGWYLTGDLGYVDAQGYVFVIDRKKDMIISGGENIYPIEVESVLSMHPQVLEVAVIGLPDARWGEAVTAVVVPREGAAPDAAALIGYCRGKIAGYKVPKSITFSATQLPKTGPGKIAKRLVRDAILAARKESA